MKFPDSYVKMYSVIGLAEIGQYHESDFSSFIALMMSSLILIRVVIVECPLRKLGMRDGRRCLASINSTICFDISFSYTFNRLGRIDIPRRSLLVVGLVALGIGEMREILQALGKWSCLMQVLIICLRGRRSLLQFA